MIYIHVPFCRSFCIYCGFYSELCPNAAAHSAIVSSGATPEGTSCIPPVGSHSRSCGPDIEVSVEAASGPSSVTVPSRSSESAIDAYVEAVLAEIELRKDEIRKHASYWQPVSCGTPIGGLCQGTGCGTSSGAGFGSGFGPSFVTRYGTGATSPDTVYFGGGTPSLLPADGVRRIMNALRSLGVTGADECTFEVNPDDIVRGGVEYVRALLETGVSRVSMGVQSLDDGILRWMGRRHDAACAREAFGILRAAGVSNISVDLIFGLPQLSDSQWSFTVDGVLSLGPEHISAYQLSVEEDSVLSQMLADGRFVEASDEQCRRQYDLLCGRLREAGYNHYEISNWARAGAEAVHNSAYWRRVPYIGLGPGAHSFSVGAASSVSDVSSEAGPVSFESVPCPSEAFPVPSAIDPGHSDSSIVHGPGASSFAPSKRQEKRSWNTQSIVGYTAESEVLTQKEAVEESIMLALRTSFGIEERELRGFFKGGRNISPEGLGAGAQDVIGELLSEGALIRDRDRIRIPEDHFFVSDDIILRLIEGLEP